ncbi:hypothetical protein C2S52_016199 [Perilla frutescens var. hirtella]|uniref:HMA domain-containing protein n=1 Tax=Perilla frutescens var. hirtella TaxID=608512 RepID=A0AAD4JJI4_PERFH|nr:hypothetical protein C2S52_016199 [Perilla frutescens var. hirtella]KAH6815057.1 hypothetical protein C2S51_019877 [Perilla frutescens var. frutescens]KAH6834469.1 hypothetical protein C2S53_004204 [Perilla frutescens var. hirtella]
MSLGRWSKEEMPAAALHARRPSETTLAAVESLALPLVQEVVFLADFRCPKCQQRVAEIMAKMNGETQSVVVSVLEKKITLTCKYPDGEKPAGRQLAHRSSWGKTSLFVRLFRSSCS